MPTQFNIKSGVERNIINHFIGHDNKPDWIANISRAMTILCIGPLPLFWLARPIIPPVFKLSIRNHT